MKAPTLLLAAFVACGPSLASDGPPLGFPEFNVDRNCEKLFKTNNGYYNQCVAKEEYGYRVLWSIWPSIPEEVQDFCVSITSNLLSDDRRLVNNLYAGIVDCVIHQKAKYDSEHPNQPKRRFSP
jgi:hypothetical protein